MEPAGQVRAGGVVVQGSGASLRWDPGVNDRRGGEREGKTSWREGAWADVAALRALTLGPVCLCVGFYFLILY